MKTTLTMIGLSALVLSVSACSEWNSASNLPEGNYENESSSVSPGGTKTTHKTTTDVDVDAQGHKTAVTKSKTTKDPKGLLNKETTSETYKKETN